MRTHTPYLLKLMALFGLSCLTLVGCGDDGDGASCTSGKCDTGQGDFDLYQPGNRFGWGGEDEYLDEIQPILAKRCVACHGCGDSPCQLKLSSYEGLIRGSNENNVFAPTVFAQDANRLKDGRQQQRGIVDYDQTEENWRDSDYYAVVSDNPENSIMTKLLTIANEFQTTERDANLQSATHQLYTDTLKGRSFECVGANQASSLSGDALATRAMPFGLEPLEPGDFEKVVSWIERGAQGPSDGAQKVLLTPQDPATVDGWEEFLNGRVGSDLDLKRYLMARYLYEHMFFAHINFAGSPGEFFEMVRSRTPNGEPIEEMVEEYIMDDPGDRVFYRFRKIAAVMARKTHTVWELNPEVMQHTDDLFLKGITPSGTVEYEVTEDPGYSTLLGNGSRNPFRYFSQIPGVIRAQFMVENSKKLIESLVKADVCTGSTATYAIRDHFWVWFLDPARDPSALSTDEVTEGLTFWNLNPFALHSTLETDDEADYQENLERQFRIHHPEGLELDDVWLGTDGGQGEDPNSWVTVLRHEKSATVEWGAVGGVPQTGWLLSYTNFERLYYDLTVNFLNWNSAKDQLETWTYFSNVRTEGEDLMLSLFPAAEREAVRLTWTQGFDTSALFDAIGAFKEGRVLSLLDGDDLGTAPGPRPSKVVFDPGTPDFDELVELMDIRRRLTPGYDDILNRSAAPGRPIGSISSFDDFDLAMDTLTGMVADHSKNLPNTTVFRVTDSAGNSEFYTVIANRGYSSNDFAFGAAKARSCDSDYVSAFRGIVGSYPELFVDLPLDRAEEFLTDVQNVQNIAMPGPGELNWLGVAAKYIPEGIVVTRYSKAFWPFVDDVHAYLADPTKNVQAEAAILDLSEYVWFAGNNSFEECGPM